MNCPSGRYTSGTSCHNCPTGRYQNSRGQTGAKIARPVGTLSQNGRSSCNTCPTGQYQNENRKTSCKHCPTGKYANQNGLSACKNCPTGQYQNGNAAVAASIVRRGSTKTAMHKRGAKTALLGRTIHTTPEHSAPHARQESTPIRTPGHLARIARLGNIAAHLEHPPVVAVARESTRTKTARLHARAVRLDIIAHRTADHHVPHALRILYRFDGQHGVRSMWGSDVPKQLWAGRLQELSCGSVQPEQCSKLVLWMPWRQVSEPAGRTSCKNCAAGQYQNQGSQAGCKSCPSGSIKTQTRRRAARPALWHSIKIRPVNPMGARAARKVCTIHTQVALHATRAWRDSTRTRHPGQAASHVAWATFRASQARRLAPALSDTIRIRTPSHTARRARPARTRTAAEAPDANHALRGSTILQMAASSA